ncbi:MAG: ABC transporter ATP-binding protein [Myxococcus sp.]|nr:ABC transporter ATP-binding protein [Myxococcus sp.]
MSGALRAELRARVGPLAIDVRFETPAGALVLVGPNGAGKTSVLSLLLGAQPVERGRIEVGGECLLDTSAGVEVPLEQRRLGYVPQDYALFPHLTVRGNVEFALASAAPALERGARRERVERVLTDLALGALAERRPLALSGGEKQRVALARALAVGPRALLLDEPLAALDVSSRREVRRFLVEWLARHGLPTVVVTHDAADARALGQRIVVLEAGRVVQSGSWAELSAAPASPFVAEFVAAP